MDDRQVAILGRSIIAAQVYAVMAANGADARDAEIESAAVSDRIFMAIRRDYPVPFSEETLADRNK